METIITEVKRIWKVVYNMPQCFIRVLEFCSEGRIKIKAQSLYYNSSVPTLTLLNVIQSEVENIGGSQSKMERVSHIAEEES